MTHPMRRFKQSLREEDTIAVLERNTNGVLALSDFEDYPYALPISYVYLDNRIYFHCAKTGHKLEILAKQNKVSFAVIDQDEVHGEQFTTYYRSVIVFGTMHEIVEDADKKLALENLAKKYGPTMSQESIDKEIQSGWNHVTLLQLDIESMSGKQSKYLMNK